MPARTYLRYMQDQRPHQTPRTWSGVGVWLSGREGSPRVAAPRPVLTVGGSTKHCARREARPWTRACGGV